MARPEGRERVNPTLADGPQHERSRRPACGRSCASVWEPFRIGGALVTAVNGLDQAALRFHAEIWDWLSLHYFDGV